MGKRVILYQDLGAMRSRLAPTFLRRRKEDVSFELPERLRSVSLVHADGWLVETRGVSVPAARAIAICARASSSLARSSANARSALNLSWRTAPPHSRLKTCVKGPSTCTRILS